MKFDNGKMIDDFTTIDNKILSKIYKDITLTKAQKNVLLSLCRQIFHQGIPGIVQTEWWGAADVTAKDVGVSERTVRRAYKELEARNIIKVRQEWKLNTDRNGHEGYRRVNRITINVNVEEWAL